MPEPPVAASYTLWRAFVPRWAYLPLSGEGARRFGGRWNPAGAPTIYAGLELSTAWAEYNQGFVQHPALIVQMKLTNARLADLTRPPVLAAYGVSDDIHLCEWRDMLDRGKIPDTHALRERLLDGGADGVIYPSFMSSGGTCVALWRWNGDEGGPKLKAVDPEHRLPTTPASWL